MVTAGVFAGRIGRWGLAFLLLFQEGIERLLHLEGVGVIVTTRAAQHLQNFAHERFSFFEFALVLQKACQIIESTKGFWMLIAYNASVSCKGCT